MDAGGLQLRFVRGRLDVLSSHVNVKRRSNDRWFRYVDRPARSVDDRQHDDVHGSHHFAPVLHPAAFSAINMWLRGDEIAAEEHARRAVEIGTRNGPQFYSATIAFWGASTVAMLRRDAHATIERSDQGTDQCVTYGYPPALHVFGVTHGWAVAALGDPDSGTEEVREHADAFLAIGARYLRPFYQAVHADTCLMGGHVDEAHRSIDDGLSVAAETGEAWFDADLHRLRGEALAAVDPCDPMAIASLRRAVEVAAAQGSEGLRARAESSLARLAAR